MTTSTVRLSRALLGALALLAVACRDGASRHASDGDTGAAAPATTRDMSATPNRGDSGSVPTGVARNDSVRAQSTGGPGTLTTKSAGTPAIKP